MLHMDDSTTQVKINHPIPHFSAHKSPFYYYTEFMKVIPKPEIETNLILLTFY